MKNTNFVAAHSALLAVILLGSSVVSLDVSASENPTAPADNRKLLYCLPTESISASPFEPLNDPTKLFYLFVLTKPYMTTDGNPGVISRWQFSPDGLTFRAEVSSSAKWSNGRRVSAREAALGIAKGMLSKSIGSKVKIIGHEVLARAGWESANPAGMRILSDDTFELKFESEVKNVSGLLREALSVSSRPSRMWPVRLESSGPGKQPKVVDDFVSPFPIVKLSADRAEIKAHGHRVVLKAGECDGGDFYGYGVPDGQFSRFHASKSHGEQAILATFNPRRSAFSTSAKRAQVGSWLRNVFKDEVGDGLHSVPGHFLAGEPGYRPGIEWSKSEEAPSERRLTILLGTQWPSNAPVRVRLEEGARKAGVTLRWKDWAGVVDEDFDVKLAGSRIQKGRALWAQGMLDNLFFGSTVKAFTATTTAMARVRAASGATVPVDNEMLQNLDIALVSEQSIIPLGRYVVNVFSKKDLPIQLVFTAEDELSFIPRR